ncbi:PDZ domain containing protein, partial [Euroglyphus maynei]
MFQQQSNFARGSGRLSMLAQNMDQWADAADRQLIKLQNNSQDNSSKTHQPSSSANHIHHSQQQYAKLLQPQQLCDSSLGSMGSNSSQENDHPNMGEKQQTNRMTVIIDLTKHSGPLGIHVLPDSSDGSSSRLKRGLEIQSIEPGSRIDCDGRLNVGDIIIEIDGHPFAGLEFERAQELFRSSLHAN